MSERADGSGTRVTTAPWQANFLAGFRAIPGLVSLGTFFASKESASATPKAFKKARREGEISFIEQQKQHANPHPPQATTPASKAK